MENKGSFLLTVQEKLKTINRLVKGEVRKDDIVYENDIGNIYGYKLRA